MNCNVCGTPLTEKIYESWSEVSLTSLCTVYHGKTLVYFCHGCGHLQSTELNNINEYYDNEYEILVESEEEDQLYEVVSGSNVFRTEHQVRTFLNKLNLPSGVKILDYGCAKSSTMRVLINRNPNINAYLFDVSDRYVPFWEKFLTEDRWATYVIPVAWNGQFDVVTSFFSLEHMAQPQDALQQICRVLKPKGLLYGIIPNVFTNTADMIVVDHVNHFTAASLQYLLRSNGFEVVEMDEGSHLGALIFTGRKEASQSVVELDAPSNGLKETFDEARKIAEFWKSMSAKVREFERSIQDVPRLAVYGAGFYGAFISSCLQHPEIIAYIVDQNPFLQGRNVNGVPIVPPAGLPDNIDVVLVGLNPAHARRLIEDIPEFSSRNLTYFFL